MKLSRVAPSILFFALGVMLGGAVGFYLGILQAPLMELRMRGQQNEKGQAEIPFDELEWASPSRLAFECGINSLEIEQGTEGYEMAAIPINAKNMNLLACVLQTSERDFKHPVSFSIRKLRGK